MRHGRRSWRAVAALLGALPTAVLACGQGEELAGPGPATLRITTATSGNASDPDGYSVAIDGRLPRAVAVLDTLLDVGVTPGEHTVDLGGISAGCVVEGGGARSATAAEGTVTSVDYLVSCTAPDPASTGALRIGVTTSGVDLDQDGYTVAIDPAESRAVAVTGEALFETVPSGPRSVRLSGLAANCSVQGQNPRPVEVTAGQETVLQLEVRCWPPLTGRIALASANQFLGLSDILVVDPQGSVVDEYFFSEDAGAPSWSPDGRFIAFQNADTMLVWEVGTFSAAPLFECFPTASAPSWSPDGSRLLCLTRGGAEGTSLYRIRRDGTDPRPLSLAGEDVHLARYVADGSVLYTVLDNAGSDITVHRIPPGGAPRRLFTLPPSFFSTFDNVVPSADGSRIAFVRDRDAGPSELYVISSDGIDQRVVSGSLRVDVSTPPAWSPDGSRIAFGVDTGEDRTLWVVSPDGSGLSQVALPGPLTFSDLLEWSPDGTRLAVAVLRETEGEPEGSIFAVRVDGSDRRQLTPWGHWDQSPAWAP